MSKFGSVGRLKNEKETFIPKSYDEKTPKNTSHPVLLAIKLHFDTPRQDTLPSLDMHLHNLCIHLPNQLVIWYQHTCHRAYSSRLTNSLWAGLQYDAGGHTVLRQNTTLKCYEMTRKKLHWNKYSYLHFITMTTAVV